MYRAVVTVTLRPSILDPQGQALRRALHDLGHEAVESVRVGKRIEVMVDAESAEAAEAVVRRACEQLLANPVMEDYTVAVEEAAVVA